MSVSAKSSPSSHARTKIVATIGPASNTAAMIAELFAMGVNVFRLNFSHGTHEDHKKVHGYIRALEKKTGQAIGIIADMQGPKLRIGTFEKGKIALKTGQNFRFDASNAPGDEKRVQLAHPEILNAVKKDDLIFLDDGKVRARIVKKGKDFLETIIESGSGLSNKKGLNVPGVVLPIPALTAKDKKDLKAALEMGVDWIAQSFVQKPDDVKQARKLIGDKAGLMVKLEKPSAIDQLDEILELCDGVMIARGDLGVEIPPEQVPSVQKQIIRKSRALGKPVIVATQMLESMITNARPTRAEASDVATAVYDGADAVMLSAETAAGEYPARAVLIMNRVCRFTEGDETYQRMMDISHPESWGDDSDAITRSAYYVAHDIDARAIVTYTASGSTALRMARQRPGVPVVCLTPKMEVARRLALSYSVHAVHMPELKGDFAGPVPLASRVLKATGIAKKGEKFIMTAGVPFGSPGSTNLLRIATVE